MEVEEEDQVKRREINHEATWTISSAKPGNGVEQILDNNLTTYWQSDGAQPHTIDIEFHQRTTVESLGIYLDVKSDESYTPKKIRFLCGSMVHDLEELYVLELNNPIGWIQVPLGRINAKKIRKDYEEKLQFLSEAPEEDLGELGRVEEVLETFHIRVEILTMHQGGKDTHIRQVKVYAPLESHKMNLFQFSTVDMLKNSCIR